MPKYIAVLRQKQSHNTQFLGLTVCVNFFQEIRITKDAAEGIKHIMNSLQYTYSVHVSSSQLLKSFEVDSSRRAAVKSSRVGCAQVDRRRLGVIFASSRVTFLYLSDSQV